jgi:hypothetical protein
MIVGCDVIGECREFFCLFPICAGTKQALFSKGKKRGKFRGRNIFLQGSLLLPTSSEGKMLREMTREMSRAGKYYCAGLSVFFLFVY